MLSTCLRPGFLSGLQLARIMECGLVWRSSFVLTPMTEAEAAPTFLLLSSSASVSANLKALYKCDSENGLMRRATPSVCFSDCLSVSLSVAKIQKLDFLKPRRWYASIFNH